MRFASFSGAKEASHSLIHSLPARRCLFYVSVNGNVSVVSNLWLFLISESIDLSFADNCFQGSKKRM